MDLVLFFCDPSIGIPTAASMTYRVLRQYNVPYASIVATAKY
jgi:methylglyoxal synthase